MTRRFHVGTHKHAGPIVWFTAFVLTAVETTVLGWARKRWHAKVGGGGLGLLVVEIILGILLVPISLLLERILAQTIDGIWYDVKRAFGSDGPQRTRRRK